MMDKKNIKKGLVIVNTGNGKGKTTAALGILFRAWGRNMRIVMLQFLKNENAHFGEIRAADKLGINIRPVGDGFTWTSKDMDKTISLAVYGWEEAKKLILSNEYDLVILDEFTYPLAFGWIETEPVIEWLKANKPPMMHLIITGRDAPQALIDYADLVSEVREVKHPFTQGIQAQPGIEF
jgi:cob(I)alamin adenosyltransferase